MTKRSAVMMVAWLLAIGAHAGAQEPFNVSVPVKHLATLFTDLYGSRGLVVDSLASLPGEQAHTAHFTSDFQVHFEQFNTAMVSQLVTLPLPSPASGFTYRFDPSLGVFQRSTQSFGPILSERAETVGAGRVSFGVAYQRFSFDTIEGLDLKKVPAVFQHDNASLRGGREDVVTTSNSIQAKVGQVTVFATIGATDRLDLSIALPVVSNDVAVVSDATIQRLGTTDSLTHFFRQATGEVGTRRLFTAARRFSGIGDLVVRAKQTLLKGASSGFAVGLDVRVPTGNALELLGTGTAGLGPFAVWSGSFNTISPHVNAGYQWNGASVLAGDPAAGTSADFPDAVTYSAGADITVSRRMTVAFDVIGRYNIDTERLHQEVFHAFDGKSTFPNIVFEKASFNTLSGSLGFKTNLWSRVLLDVNVLFALDSHGVRDKVTPLIGFEYAF
jgi:hypothetical protein